jgi:hypothetical protein
VPKTVVDGLEVVQIQKQDGEPAMGPLESGDSMLKPILKQGSIAKARQRIVEGLK